MAANLRKVVSLIHSPDLGSFEFSHSPPKPNGLPSFMAMV